MKTGGIVTNQQQRWYEPQHVVLGSSTYFTHAWGSIYVVSGQVAYDIARIRQGRLRYLANEGGWTCEQSLGPHVLSFISTEASAQGKHMNRPWQAVCRSEGIASVRQRSWPLKLLHAWLASCRQAGADALPRLGR